MAKRGHRIELTRDAIDVAKAFMGLCDEDRQAFKRAIQLHYWLLCRRGLRDGPIRVLVADAESE